MPAPEELPGRLDGILAAVGNTPLVELKQLLPGFAARIFAKIEKFNPGGSIKDRPALYMLISRIRDGRLSPGSSVVVESSSGNLGIGIAQVCRYFRLPFICVVDAKTTEQNIAILRAYQASVEVITEPDPRTGEFLPARLRRVRELVAELPSAYWPNQYANPLNSAAHEQTMAEIVRDVPGAVDYLFCATSSCGTVRGCADYARAHDLATMIVAVDAVGSVIFTDEEPAPRLIPGHGASVRPPLLRPGVADEVVHVSDLDCVVGCRRLLNRESILAGGSSGATVAAVDAMRARIRPGSNCVVVLPDGGDRYLDTIYSDRWVRSHFGEVTHLWKDTDGHREDFECA
ncbi:MAG TPA: 2,3-diaminopropionate biosynthesis protein SbnA [Streptosporangiaceae bacterium]|jgi:N-(2-amino-2-carboxyethyl)-L-glutamate synthase|nr:2,3-diaminopropionate biosynthesis protein SbnA [Streptosporangiaceae bacterium]